MQKFMRATIIAFLAAATFACATPVPPTLHTVFSDDGTSELAVPESWYERPDFGRTASLRVAEAEREIYLLVNSYFPDEYDPMPLEEFTKRVTMQLAKNLTDARMSGPRQLAVNGRPAVEYEFSANLDDTRLAYLSTAVEGRHARHHLIAWTSAERWGSNRDGIRAAVASFRESDTRRAATPRTELAFKWPKRLTSTVSFHNKGEKRGEVTELRGEIVTTVRPGDNDQLLVSSRAISRKLTTGSKDKARTDYLQQVLKEAMTDLPDYVISGDGSFVGIENLGAYHQRIEAAILKGLPEGPEAGREKARQLVKTALSEQVLAAMIQDEWNNVVGNWSGGAYVPGRNYEFLMFYQSPALAGQVFPMTVTQQLKGYTPCHAGAAAKSCVRLLQTSRVTGPDFTRATDRLVRKTVGRGVKVDSVEVVKTVEVVTEPKTLLPHSVRSQEVKTVVVTGDGKSQTSKEVDETSSTYSYRR